MSEPHFNLDGIRFNAPVTAPNGVINTETIFHFEQDGSHVEARYQGGKVRSGWLVGILEADRLQFRYAQSHADGTIDGGSSDCTLRHTGEGLIEIVERFEWSTGPGGNIIRQLKAERSS